MPERIAKFLGWERAAKGEGRRSYALTDMGNGERFADQHRNRARYCHPFGKWFIHDGKRYAADEAGGIGKLAKDTVRGMYAQASAIEDEEHRKSLAKHARDSEARGRVDAMLHMAQSEDGIPVSPQDLDRDPWLLNVANGTVDLRTWGFRMNGTKTSSADWFGERTEYAVSDEIGEVERVPAMQLDVFPDQRR